MVRAILFDCDGVLVDSEILALEVETAMLAEHGLVYDVDEFKLRFMGMSEKAFYVALNADSVARYGCPLPDNFERDCGRRLYEEVERRLEATAGAAAAIERLSCKKAVVSSSRRDRLAIKLKKAGLLDLFVPHLYSSDDVEHAKPAPDLFLHAARALEVSADQCLVIEDSVNGVLAGLAAGMRVWGFTGGGHVDDVAKERLRAAGAGQLLATWPEVSEALAAL